MIWLRFLSKFLKILFESEMNDFAISTNFHLIIQIISKWRKNFLRKHFLQNFFLFLLPLFFTINSSRDWRRKKFTSLAMKGTFLLFMSWRCFCFRFTKDFRVKNALAANFPSHSTLTSISFILKNAQNMFLMINTRLLSENLCETSSRVKLHQQINFGILKSTSMVCRPWKGCLGIHFHVVLSQVWQQSFLASRALRVKRC